MGIETAALIAAAAEAGTAAAAAGASTAAAGLTAAEVAAGAATAAEAGGAVAAGSGIAAGSLEAANVVGALGGDALGAFISANQGFGTMTAMESIQGMGAALSDSPLIQGMQQAAKAPEGEQTTVVKSSGPPQQPTRPNQNPGLTNSTLQNSPSKDAGAASLAALGFADGGIVPALKQLFPQNIFDQTAQRRELEAGLSQSKEQQPQQGNVTINIGGGGQQEKPVPRSTVDSSDLVNMIKRMTGYQDGGAVRTGSSDVRAGGEIRGPHSQSGKDNQIIKVAGGEGILPVDVMEVPGVADLVKNLIKTYHKPV